MKRVVSIITAVVVMALLSLSGYVAVSMASDDKHTAMMQQGDLNCVDLCLSNMTTYPSVPVIQKAIQILLLIVFAVVSLYAIKLSAPYLATYTIRPRPSPNLIKLYAHYRI